MTYKDLKDQVELIKKHLGAEWPFDSIHTTDEPFKWYGRSFGSLSRIMDDSGVVSWQLEFRGQTSDVVLGPGGLFRWSGDTPGFVTMWRDGVEVPIASRDPAF